MRKLRDVVLAHTSWIACFDMRPSSLFEGVAQRLAILLLKKSESLVGHTLTGGYRRWTTEERPALMATIAYTSVTLDQTRPGAIPKLASALEGRLLAKLVGVPLSQLWDDAASPIYVHRIVRYFVKALSFIPVFVGHEGVAGKSEDYKEFRFAETEQMPAVDLLNSSLFYWFWRLHSDGFHCGYGDVFRMRYDRSISAQSRSQLHVLHEDLMEGFRKSSVEKAVQTKSGSIRYQEFRPKAVKPIIDEIDRVLARHYDFTDEDLDFIINYDIKYRMGDELEATDETE